VWTPQKRARTCYIEHVFLHSVGSAGHVVGSGAFEVWNVDALIFVLMWYLCGSHKMCDGTSYMNMCFCIRWDIRVTQCVLIRTGHVRPNTYRAWNVDALFFMLMWAWCRYHKKRVGTYHAKHVSCIRWYLWVTLWVLVRPGSEMSTHYSSCSGGLGADPTKSTMRHVTPNLCFCILYILWVT
jgi:hypothetical protein